MNFLSNVRLYFFVVHIIFSLSVRRCMGTSSAKVQFSRHQVHGLVSAPTRRRYLKKWATSSDEEMNLFGYTEQFLTFYPH